MAQPLTEAIWKYEWPMVVSEWCLGGVQRPLAVVLEGAGGELTRWWEGQMEPVQQ